MCPCVPDRTGIWKCLFLRRRKKRSTRKKTSQSKGEKQKQSQPSCGVHTKIRTRATLVGGEWSDTLTNAPPLLLIMAAILHVLYFCFFFFFVSLFSCFALFGSSIVCKEFKLNFILKRDIESQKKN